MILSGVVWGVKRGCAIAAAGTVMGEMACFTYVVKLTCNSSPS
jgi:uncharacterized membrane protein YdjX (TVP38/TMEM64 family)